MKFLDYLQEVREMNLPLGEYAILGSGPLAVRGIRETKDVDLIVTPELWKEYRKKEGWEKKLGYDVFYLKKGHVELWKRITWFWDRRIDIKAFIERAEIIEGLPFVNMKDFIYWKGILWREKDKRDVVLAEEYMRTH
jgi:hypothetical protein